MESLINDKFSIIINANVISWIGKITMMNPGEVLDKYLIDIANQFKETDILIDFSKLEYMNSSSIPPILRFFKLCGLSKNKIIVYYNRYQKRNFIAFKTISPTIFKNIEFIENTN